MEISIKPLLAVCPRRWRSKNIFFLLWFISSSSLLCAFFSAHRWESRSQYKISLLLPLSLVALLRFLVTFLTTLLSFIYWINGNNEFLIWNWFPNPMASSVVAFFFSFIFSYRCMKRIEQLKHSRITNLLLQLDQTMNDSTQFDAIVLRIYIYFFSVCQPSIAHCQ